MHCYPYKNHTLIYIQTKEQHNTSTMKIILFHHHQSLFLIVIGIITMIAKGNGEFVMKCSHDQCASFNQTTVIDGCTMISSSDDSSQAFTYDPKAEDPSCALKTFSDESCTSMLSCTSYDVFGLSCSAPGRDINPCGTGIYYRIEESGGTPTMSSTASLIFAMMMLLSFLW
jgi:hypothetical protein